MASYYLQIAKPENKSVIEEGKVIILGQEDVLKLSENIPYSEPYPKWILQLSPTQQTQMLKQIEEVKKNWDDNQSHCTQMKPIFIDWFFQQVEFKLFLRIPPFSKTVKYQPQPISAPWYWSKKTVNIITLREMTKEPLSEAYLGKVYDTLSHLKIYPDKMTWTFNKINILSKGFSF